MMMMMMAEVFLATPVYLPFNRPMQLLAKENFIEIWSL